MAGFGGLAEMAFAGNGNGVLDPGDLATQVQRSSSQTQTMDINEMDLRYSFDWDSSSLTFGANYRDARIVLYIKTNSCFNAPNNVANVILLKSITA